MTDDAPVIAKNVGPHFRIRDIIYHNGKYVGLLEQEGGGFWRARTAEGSSLGVYSTRAAAERAVLTVK